MARTFSISSLSVTTVDIQTVFYNRGTVDVTPPLGTTPLATLTSRYIPGNATACSKPGLSIRNGNILNSLNDYQAFTNVAGYRWRQVRTLAASGTYAISPRADCESTFIITAAGNTDVTLDLTDATILPGMTFRFARPASAGNLVITLSNGVVMTPATGATGTVITVTQYGAVTLRILGSAVPSGPKVFLEEASNYSVA